MKTLFTAAAALSATTIPTGTIRCKPRSGAVNTRDGFTAPNRPDMTVPAGTPMNGTIRGRNTSGVSWRAGKKQGMTDTWHWQGEVKCTDPAAAGANKPPTQATVDVATDIYDKPDGRGQKIGILYPGEVHPLMEPCHDDWCRVGQIELGGYEGLTNGTARVYTKGYITLS